MLQGPGHHYVYPPWSSLRYHPCHRPYPPRPFFEDDEPCCGFSSHRPADATFALYLRLGSYSSITSSFCPDCIDLARFRVASPALYSRTSSTMAPTIPEFTLQLLRGSSTLWDTLTCHSALPRRGCSTSDRRNFRVSWHLALLALPPVNSCCCLPLARRDTVICHNVVPAIAPSSVEGCTTFNNSIFLVAFTGKILATCKIKSIAINGTDDITTVISVILIDILV